MERSPGARVGTSQNRGAIIWQHARERSEGRCEMRHTCFSMLTAGLLLGLLMPMAGCYDQSAVNQFLLQPRRPVSGIEYRVLPPDQIAIRSLRVAEINAVTQRIRPDGKLNLPLVGEVYVAGMTATEMEAAITQAARTYYNEVDVTVDVTGYASQRYYVFGQVAGPGPRPWTGHDTLLDALAQAQPTELAWPQRIKVVRGDQPQEGGCFTCTQPEPQGDYKSSGVRPENPDNPRRTMIINLHAMIKDGDMSNNIMLLPNDVIYVQANPLAKIGLALQSLLFPVRPGIETIATPASVGGL